MTIETGTGPDTQEPVMANTVVLRGRVSQEPVERTLPSGDRLVSFRVVVPRPPEEVRGRQTVDVVDCAVWTDRLRRQCARWRAGDLVEVAGALRKRFFRAGNAPASRVEVEVRSGRIIRRSDSS